MEDKIKRLNELRKQRNAVILAHYYQPDEIQEVADFLGDSLALAQRAKSTDADVILFCGVHFMAETAKILNPQRIVLLPDLNSGCSLADSAPEKEFRLWCEAHADHTVISYVNCSTQVKAMSDIICTSSNAEKIINSLPKDEKICFAPDKNLGAYLNKKCDRNMVLWDGSCEVHNVFSEESLKKIQRENLYAPILAHPECPENLLGYADFVGSTKAILDFAKKCDSTEFIILTELGVNFRLKKENPNKTFHYVEGLGDCGCNTCKYMKLNTIDKMINALENLEPQINLPEDLRLRALKPLERMLELSK